jgi:Cobalamin biosynthesis protein CobN and related Mg-chelatases
MIIHCHKPVLTAGFALAMIFTLSCSGDGGGGDNNPGPGISSSNSSSSSNVSSSGVSSSSATETGISSSSVAISSPSGVSSSSVSGGGNSSAVVSVSSSSINLTVVGNCKGTPYYENQFCHNNSIIVNYCGQRFEEYDPDKYECKDGSNGIYLKGGFEDSRDGKIYAAVLIGSQVWMAKNLNYAVGGKCGDGKSLSDANTATCSTYGRLYDWNTAMANSASSAANPSGIQGVCPDGWHLPSDAEWKALTNSIGTNAGTKLKAASGWSSGNGTDDYGFSALPGGAYYNSTFMDVRNQGYWWSATEYTTNTNAYGRNMSYNSTIASNSIGNKTNTLYSVRCVQN